MPTLEPVTLVIRGPHNSGRTTLANFLKMFFDEHGYRDVKVEDVAPLPEEQKGSWPERWARNRDLRPIRVRVELAGESERDHEREACAQLVEQIGAEQVRRLPPAMLATLQASETTEAYRRRDLCAAIAATIRNRGR